MTIAAALLCSEGLVLGADSAATTQDAKGKVINIAMGAQKIFQLGLDRPYGIVFFGQAGFGPWSPRELVVAFEKTLVPRKNPPIREVARAFHEFAQKRWHEFCEQAHGPELEEIPDTYVFIGGRGDDEITTSFARISLRGQGSAGKPRAVQQSEMGPFLPADEPLLFFEAPGLFCFEGRDDAALRLIYGMDWYSVMMLAASGLIEKEDVGRAFEVLSTPNPWRAAPHELMSLRDALDYVHFIVVATVKYFKFIGEHSYCGGKAELACVTADRGFRWVTHKSLDWCVGHTEGQTEYSPLDPHRLGR